MCCSPKKTTWSLHINSENMEMRVKKEMISRNEEFVDGIIHSTLHTRNTSIVDDIEIKHEVVGFHNGTTSLHANDDELMPVSNIQHAFSRCMDWKLNANVECRVVLKRIDDIKAEKEVQKSEKYQRMSGSHKFMLSSKDFHLTEMTVMKLEKEMMTKEDESTEKFIPYTVIPPTQTTSGVSVDDVDIKYEEVDFHQNFTSNSEIRTEPKVDLNDFYLDLLQCDPNCLTCQKYMRILSEHIRASHVPQPILLIDPETSLDQQYLFSSSTPIKCKDIEQMECSEEDSKSNSECGQNLQLENENESGPDYFPTTPTQRVFHQNVVQLNDQTKISDVNSSKRKSRIKKSTRKKQCETRRQHKSIQKNFNCQQCGKEFRTPLQLKMHSGISHSFKCSGKNCTKSYTRGFDLFEHFKTNHTPDQLTNDSTTTTTVSPHLQTRTEKIFLACEHCKMAFVCVEDLNYHLLNHTREKFPTCEICKKQFVRMEDLTEHLSTHKGGISFGCIGCKTIFKDKTITKHLDWSRMHVRQRSECTKCDKVFSWKCALDSHLKNDKHE